MSFAFLIVQALFVSTFASPHGIQPKGELNNLPNTSINKQNEWHTPQHRKPIFEDRNFDHDSLTDAETENAAKLIKKNEPLLHNNNENKQNEMNSPKHKQDEHLPVRRRKPLTAQTSEAKLSKKKIFALSILFLLTWNPTILLMMIQNGQHERTIVSLNEMSHCKLIQTNPPQYACKVDMPDTDYNGKFDIYAKTEKDKNHLSFVTKIDANECELGKDLVVDKWHTGEAKAKCKQYVEGIVDLDDKKNKIELSNEEAFNVLKYERESSFRRSLTDPGSEYTQKMNEKLKQQRQLLDSMRYTSQYNEFKKSQDDRRYYEHPSFAELYRQRKQKSEEKFKTYSTGDAVNYNDWKLIDDEE